MRDVNGCHIFLRFWQAAGLLPEEQGRWVPLSRVRGQLFFAPVQLTGVCLSS